MKGTARENILRWYIAAMVGWGVVLYSSLHWWLRFSLEFVGMVWGVFALILTFAFTIGNLTSKITDPRLRAVARIRWGTRMILVLGLGLIFFLAWFAHAKAGQSWFVALFETVIGGGICTATAWIACRTALKRLVRNHPSSTAGGADTDF